MAKENTPEITNTDLVPVALELALWGATDTTKLLFLDPPPRKEFERAQNTLRTLGALDSHNKITPHGKIIASLGVHPRFAHMLITAKERGFGGLACDVAALLEERDILGARANDVSLFERWYEVSKRGEKRSPSSHTPLARLHQQIKRLESLLRVSSSEERDPDALGLMIALAYPERIGMQRAPQEPRYLLANGVGAELSPKSLLTKHQFLAVAELDSGRAHARIFLAEPISESMLRNHFKSHIEKRAEVIWDPETATLSAKEIEFLGELRLVERRSKPTRDGAHRAIVEVLKERGLAVLPWSDEAKALLTRMRWAKERKLKTDSWPDFTDEALLATLDEWLMPFINDEALNSGLKKLDLAGAISSRLSWDERKYLDAIAPPFLQLPSGTKASIDYSRGEVPVLSIYLQELFGQRETPRVGNGTVPLLIELLSPARRPLQVTKDLTSFWTNAYREVRTEMLARYPRHYWPENPMEAAPTKRGRKPKG